MAQRGLTNFALARASFEKLSTALPRQNPPPIPPKDTTTTPRQVRTVSAYWYLQQAIG